VPIEVLPFARAYCTRIVAQLGGTPVLRTRDGTDRLTDQGNLILDTRFGPIPDPAALARQLSLIPGVVGHGLFIDEIDAFYLADGGIVTRIERPGSN
jgi:ribose 5-phosphate isomerase A